METVAGREPIRSLESPIGVMHLLQGAVIWHVLNVGAVVDARSAKAVQELTQELAAGESVAIVVDLRLIGFADRDAREMFARGDSGGAEVATALLVGPVIGSWLAGKFMNEAHPDRPVAAFMSEAEALEWALAKAQGARG